MELSRNRQTLLLFSSVFTESIPNGDQREPTGAEIEPNRSSHGGGMNPEWIGNGYCDEDCNIEECGFDELDCVGESNSNKTENIQTFFLKLCS